MPHTAFRMRQKIIKKSVFRFNHPLQQRARKSHLEAKIAPFRDRIEEVLKQIFIWPLQNNLVTWLSVKFPALEYEIDS